MHNTDHDIVTIGSWSNISRDTSPESEFTWTWSDIYLNSEIHSSQPPKSKKMSAKCIVRDFKAPMIADISPKLLTIEKAPAKFSKRIRSIDLYSCSNSLNFIDFENTNVPQSKKSSEKCLKDELEIMHFDSLPNKQNPRLATDNPVQIYEDKTKNLLNNSSIPADPFMDTNDKIPKPTLYQPKFYIPTDITPADRGPPSCKSENIKSSSSDPLFENETMSNTNPDSKSLISCSLHPLNSNSNANTKSKNSPMYLNIYKNQFPNISYPLPPNKYIPSHFLSKQKNITESKGKKSKNSTIDKNDHLFKRKEMIVDWVTKGATVNISKQAFPNFRQKKLCKDSFTPLINENRRRSLNMYDSPLQANYIPNKNHEPPNKTLIQIPKSFPRSQEELDYSLSHLNPNNSVNELEINPSLTHHTCKDRNNTPTLFNSNRQSHNLLENKDSPLNYKKSQNRSKYISHRKNISCNKGFYASKTPDLHLLNLSPDPDSHISENTSGSPKQTLLQHFISNPDSSSLALDNLYKPSHSSNCNISTCTSTNDISSIINSNSAGISNGSNLLLKSTGWLINEFSFGMGFIKSGDILPPSFTTPTVSTPANTINEPESLLDNLENDQSLDELLNNKFISFFQPL
ncbi:hypothetical protein AYI69_g4512 [Smittium culicis]|uniref:Uncharacterized protein n=1 Tax=Smittium culicis TaxID=133412 RepID=A0A1R1YD15_9FUNG|nr:hypothetical protein AYI69_g4512 [Smittium culicis]